MGSYEIGKEIAIINMRLDRINNDLEEITTIIKHNIDNKALTLPKEVKE